MANGEEGEPGSVKDRWLLRARPHLVLDGLARAAEITGAERGYVYVSDTAAGERIRRALAERTPRLPCDVVETPHTYVAGEETAVVRRINGGPALPTAKPPRPYQQGVGGAPTLVANVETLARIALIAARPDRRRRTARTTLVTLARRQRRAVARRGLLRLHPADPGAGPGRPRAGRRPHGRPLRRADRPRLTSTSHWNPTPSRPPARHWAAGRSASSAPTSARSSLASVALAHLAAESARQCGICVAGTGSIRDAVAALTTGTADPGLLARLHRWSTSLPGRGACGLLDAAAGTAGSLLRAFPHLVRSHLDGPCPDAPRPPTPAGSPWPSPYVAGRTVPRPRSAPCTR